MQRKLLQTVDKLLFVKQLYDYSSRAVNQKVKGEYATKTGMSESTFRDKMCGHRVFKGFELDVVESAFTQELGQAVIDEQFEIFIKSQSDGDKRTIENAQDREIKELSEFNDQLAVSKLLV